MCHTYKTFQKGTNGLYGLFFFGDLELSECYSRQLICHMNLNLLLFMNMKADACSANRAPWKQVAWVKFQLPLRSSHFQLEGQDPSWIRINFRVLRKKLDRNRINLLSTNSICFILLLIVSLELFFLSFWLLFSSDQKSEYLSSAGPVNTSYNSGFI